MLGRIFGRGKDEPDQAVCAECGRTLLAGEWTQKVVGADGEELLICSLCGQSHALSGAEPVAVSRTPANNGRVRDSREEVGPRVEARDTRAESDAFWKALKEKDTQIELLQAQLAHVEAEKQELVGQLAHARTPGAGDAPVMPAPVERPFAAIVPAEPLVPSAAGQPPSPAGAPWTPGDSSEPGERTWGETPAEFAAELAALRDEADATSPATPSQDPTELASSEPEASGVVFEDTQPIPAVPDDPSPMAGTSQTPPVEPQPDGDSALTVGLAQPLEVPPDTLATAAGPTAADLEAEAASLTLLQRGVDLLNVSRVPHKIAETNEQLGLPSVHVGFDGATTAVTFMWSMGWYRFHVDSESGDVRMVDRGYDELTELRPNAGVRADGTVQLAPAQISRAAQRPQPEPPAQAAAPEAVPAAPTRPEPPSVAAQKPPEILSKSLLGQRSDDEAASWEHTQARDFDWDR